MKKKTTREWIKELESIGLPCGPLNSIADAAADPLLLSRNMFVDLPAPETEKGTMRVVNTPFKMSKTAAGAERGAPILAEHTAEVLSKVLGMKQGEIEELESEKVIETYKG